MSTFSASTLVVRLGAMGDIIHTLPAAASLKNSFPDRRLVWVVKERWMPLLEGNPFIDEFVVAPDKRSGFLAGWHRKLRVLRPALAVDFQGLLQSALIGRLAGAKQLWGFDRSVARERLAPFFYTHSAAVTGPHRVQRNLQLVRAAGGTKLTTDAWLPPGEASGSLPSQPFVLASPLAGWTGKQWPTENYEALGRLLSAEGLVLVLNVPAKDATRFASSANVAVHTSSIAGLIHATRSAIAVVGVDSGPLHMAAALGKPGAAIFGPTDPSATGPFGGTLAVLRTPGVATTYDRHNQIQDSMRAITPEQVFNTVMRSIEVNQTSAVLRR